MAEELGMTPDQHSCAILTATIDDFVFIALDEATKRANVTCSYAKTFYGGNPNSSSKLQGEGIGIIAGPTVGEVKAAVEAVKEIEENKIIYAVSCNEDDSICYLTYTVSRIGSFFAEMAGIPEGSAMGYAAGPSVESIYASDYAVKASGATMVKFFAPPTETNSSGALFFGTQSECAAACKAFGEGVQSIADDPIQS